MTEDKTAVEEYRREVQVECLIRVMSHQFEEGLTVAEACEAEGLAPSTFYYLLNQGVLNEYLAELRKSRVEHAQSLAAASLPEVIQHQIDIATGQVEPGSGVNPTSAAKFVAAQAGASGKKSGGQGRSPSSARAFLPQMVVFAIQGGAPITDEEGRLVVDGIHSDAIDLESTGVDGD